MIALFEELAALGTELEITGKTPFFLDDPETVWCVLEGEVNVYVAARDGDAQTGGRDFLFRAAGGGPGNTPQHQTGTGFALAGNDGQRPIPSCQSRGSHAQSGIANGLRAKAP